MSEGARGPAHPIQDGMGAPSPKRPYAQASVAEAQGRFFIRLDGREARTPGRHPLHLPSREAGDTVAAEWTAQGERVDPFTMPMTRLAYSALDAVAPEPARFQRAVLDHAACDLLCYRASEPDRLVARQAAAWDPVLAWADETLGARFLLSEGIVFVAQPPASLAAIEMAVADCAVPFDLAALHAMTVLTGSALLALAAARGRLSAEAAWSAAHVDEDAQIEAWGEDAEASRRRDARWRDFMAAFRLRQ